MIVQQLEQEATDLLNDLADDLTDLPKEVVDGVETLKDIPEGLLDAAKSEVVALKNEAELLAMQAVAAAEKAAKDAVASTIRSLESQIESATSALVSPITDKAAELQAKAGEVVSDLSAVPLNIGTELTKNVTMLGNAAGLLANFEAPGVSALLASTVDGVVGTVDNLTGLLSDLTDSAVSSANAMVNQGLATVTDTLDNLQGFIQVPNLESLVSLDGVSSMLGDAGVSITKFISGLEAEAAAILDMADLPGLLDLNAAANSLANVVPGIKGTLSGLPVKMEEYISSVANVTGKFKAIGNVISGAVDDIDLTDLIGDAPGLAAEAFLPQDGTVPSKHLAANDGYDSTVSADRLAKVFAFGRQQYYDKGKERYQKLIKGMEYRKAVALKINDHGS